jgi:glycosyltransferase involved in cell wall biosynthesis
MDTISIIVPVYKVETYLEKCLESIVSQTYTNLEIILVDDGSPDRSGEICDKWAINDNRIKVLHKKNGGLSDARNKGIEIATGQYLVFVDSDDYIDKDMILSLHALIKERNADICICNYYIVRENGDVVKESYTMDQTVLTGRQVLTNKLFEDHSWIWIVAWNKMYKKALFSEIRYAIGKLHEDEFIAHEIYNQCNNVACTDEPLYYYVQRTGSIMSQENNIHRLDSAEAYFQRALYLEEKGYDFSTIERTICKGIEEFQKFFYRNPHAYQGVCKKRVQELQRLFNRSIECGMEFSDSYQKQFSRNRKGLYNNWKLAKYRNKCKSLLRSLFGRK